MGVDLTSNQVEQIANNIADPLPKNLKSIQSTFRMLLFNALPTLKRIKFINNFIDTSCRICKKEAEKANHLFLTCEKVVSFYGKVLNNINNIYDLLLCNPMSKEKRNKILVAIHSVWVWATHKRNPEDTYYELINCK